MFEEWERVKQAVSVSRGSGRAPQRLQYPTRSLGHVPRAIIKFMDVELDSDSNHSTECLR